MTYWILFILVAGPGGHSIAVERVNYATEAACDEAARTVISEIRPSLAYATSFCLKAESIP